MGSGDRLALFPTGYVQLRDGENSPLSGAEVKDTCSYIAFRHTILWCQWLSQGQFYPLSEEPRMELVQLEDGVFLYSIVRYK
jgi:hypothetical protein